MSVYIETKTLPDCLQRALASVGYGRKDISIEPSETASVFCGGGDGYRGFTIVCDLSTGQSAITWGSWGGSNAFNPGNAVDTDSTEYPLKPGTCVINGSTGGGKPVYATITIHPSNAAPLLPAKPELTDRERAVLACFKSLTSAGRKNEWERHPKSRPSEAELDALVAKGLITRNKAGAVAITTAGRNAAGRLL